MISVNLDSLQGWKNLTAGAHTVQVEAKSSTSGGEKSAGVAVVKPTITTPLSVSNFEIDITTHTITGLSQNHGYISILNIPATYSIENNVVVDGTDYNILHIENNAFRQVSGIYQINIPNNIETIGNQAFRQVSDIFELDIPNSITQIGSLAFIDTLIENLVINSLTAWFNIDFIAATANPLQYTSSAMKLNNQSLTTINVPDSVTTIKNFVFFKYASLNTLNIGKSVTMIQSSALTDILALQTITVSNDNENFIVEDGILYDTNKTTLYVLPAQSNITSITIPNSVTTICGGALGNNTTLLRVNSNTDGEFNLPDTINTIWDRAFLGSDKIINMHLPNNLTEITSYMLSGCSQLATINIPSGVTSIGASAFSNCIALENITLPSGVTNIGFLAFSGCSNLTRITCLATTPPIVSTSTFKDTTCIIYVPAESVSAYQNATNWSSVADRIQAIPSEE